MNKKKIPSSNRKIALILSVGFLLAIVFVGTTSAQVLSKQDEQEITDLIKDKYDSGTGACGAVGMTSFPFYTRSSNFTVIPLSSTEAEVYFTHTTYWTSTPPTIIQPRVYSPVTGYTLGTECRIVLREDVNHFEGLYKKIKGVWKEEKLTEISGDKIPTPISFEPVGMDIETLLNKSWGHYKKYKISANGRPMDFDDFDDSEPSSGEPHIASDLDKDNITEGDWITTSEGVSYALLRAVLMNDQIAFDKVWNWTTNNMQRKGVTRLYRLGTDLSDPWIGSDWINVEDLLTTDPEVYWKFRGKGQRALFCWRYIDTIHGTSEDGIIFGKGTKAAYEINSIDCASDADQDIALALIFADKRWGSTGAINYLDESLEILDALWQYVVQSRNPRYTCYFTAGDTQIYLDQDPQTGSPLNGINPSYLAPYAYKIFSDVDYKHDWMAVVNSSYDIVYGSGDATLTTQVLIPIPPRIATMPAEGVVNLPPQWCSLMEETPEDISRANIKNYLKDHSWTPVGDFVDDAMRTLWRVAVDYKWFSDTRAAFYLEPTNPTVSNPEAAGPYGFLLYDWLNDLSNGKKKLPSFYNHDGTMVGEREFNAFYGPYLAYTMRTDAIINPQDDMHKEILRKLTSPYDPINNICGYVEDEDGIYWHPGYSSYAERDPYRNYNSKDPKLDYYGQNWIWFGLGLLSGKISNNYGSLQRKSPNVNSLIAEVSFGDILITVKGSATNPVLEDFTFIEVTNQVNGQHIQVKLIETGPNTQTFTGVVHLTSGKTSARDNYLKASDGDTIKIQSLCSPSYFAFVTADLSYRAINRFEYYKDADILKDWEFVTSIGGFVELHTDTTTFASEGSMRSLKIYTNIPPANPRYEQIHTFFPEQDWSDYNSIQIMVKGDEINEKPYGDEFSICIVDGGSDRDEVWCSTRWFDRKKNLA
jgi:hypothetical protein